MSGRRFTSRPAKPYAIKALPPIIASNPDAWDQVRRNFDIIENLNHPTSVRSRFSDRDPKYGPYLVRPMSRDDAQQVPARAEASPRAGRPPF